MFDLVFFILFIFMFFIIPFLFIFLTYKIFSNRYRDFAFNETKRKEIIQNLEKESEKFFDTIEISNKDFFSNVKSISEYVHYKYIQLLNKSESLKFYLIKKEEPFVLAKAYLLGAIKTLNIFSWKNPDRITFYPQYFKILNMTKVKGEPEQEINLKWKSLDLPKTLVTDSSFIFNLTLKNEGQAIFAKKEGFEVYIFVYIHPRNGEYIKEKLI